MKLAMMRKILIIGLLALAACTARVPQDARSVGALPPVTPDVTGVTVPSNIAPLTFAVDGADHVVATFDNGRESVAVDGRDGYVAIGIKPWRRLLADADSLTVTVYAQSDGEWVRYAPFAMYVAEPIDSHLAYRLIEPGYEVWSQMGIYQRDLTSYDESPIVTNELTNSGCMNCHSFCQRDPGRMLFHLRVDYPGTYLLDGSEGCTLQRLEPKPALVYPSWHPSGKYVAFSTNSTKQMFHLMDPNRIEVFDYASDVVVYDVDHQRVISTPWLSAETSYETFPTFSSDGATLYFCTADSVVMPGGYDRVRYSLCSVAFDAATGAIGERVDTLYNANAEGRSVSFPRVSPDNRWLVYTLHDYGNFSIWHPDADLYIIDLQSGEHRPLDSANSPNATDSYHSWSSNGRWLAYSSRRQDGLYTRPHFVHIDADGRAAKPFVLPQRDKDYYTFQMKSYNVPELVSGPVTLTPADIRAAISQEGAAVK